MGNNSGTRWGAAAGLGVLVLCCGGHALLGLGALTAVSGVLAGVSWLGAGGFIALVVGALLALRMLKRSRACYAKHADSTAEPRPAKTEPRSTTPSELEGI